MRKTLKITIIFLFVNVICYAQSGAATNPQMIPNYNLPTPEASKFTQYGEIPVNESSGLANMTIPLFNFEAGKISIPFSLSHSGGAVKVDEDNTWTGINWQLNGGGVITRVVNDMPDEKCQSGQRVFYNSSQLNSFIPNQSEELAALALGSKDSEVDIFNYNFSGYSGSFYLDENLEPRLIKYDKELKIEISNDPIVGQTVTYDKRTITITTNDGTRYYFGGTNASESTRLRREAFDFTPSAQTAFYLFKIENIYGDIATLNYTVGGNSIQTIGYNQEYSIDTSIEGDSECAPSLGATLTQRSPYFLQSSGRVNLSSITYNRGLQKILFETSLISDFSNTQLRLDNIIFINEKSESIKNINLNYIYPNNQNWIYKRFFLSAILIKNGGNTVLENKYNIEYNTPELLPERFSYSQDYAGYFNGKNNSNYVPKVNDLTFELGNNYQSLADKSVVFETTCYGSVKKITYPTGGYSEFEYETGLDENNPIYEIENKYLNIYHNNPNTNNTSLHVDTANTLIYPPDDSVIIQPSILNVTNSIRVKITGEVNGYLTQHHFIKFVLDHIDSSNDIVKIIELENPSGDPKYIEREYEFTNLQPNGRYTFRFEYYRTSNTAYPNFMTATAHVVFNTNIPIPKYKPGIRVKRVKNYESSSAIPLVTRYYYNLAGQRNSIRDSQIILRQPRFTCDAIVTGTCWTQPDSEGWSFQYPYTIFKRKIFSETQNNIYISDNNMGIYRYVTVSYGGDNFENGGKQTEYFIQQDIPLSSFSFFGNDYISEQKASNNSLKNGTVLKEIYFKSNATFGLNGIFNTGIVKEITYTYINLPEKSGSVTNCFISKLFARPEGTGVNDLYVQNYYFGYYNIYSWWHTLESTLIKEYFDNGIVETLQTYYYDSKLAGLPSRIIKTVGVETSEIRMDYPPDLPNEAGMSMLTAQFRIGEPIITSEFRNGSLLTKTKKVYPSSNDENNYYYAPTSIQTLKNGANVGYEDRIVFHKYDDYGNPIEISKGLGSKIVYIWGYNKSKPIAKIENTTYTQVEPYVINLQTLSNSNDEQSLLTNLNNLRSALPLSLVTTYTYKSQIGISSITDPKGDFITYIYDDFNRLKEVRDRYNNIVSEHEYHYRTQN